MSFLTGGYSDLSEAARKQGNYVGYVGWGFAGAVIGAGNFLTGGEVGAATNSVKTLAAVGASEGVRITEKGLALVEVNLARFEPTAANVAMVSRLEDSFKVGTKALGADANFYLHEIAEGTARKAGLAYDAAHVAAIEKYGVSPFSLYHHDVVTRLPSEFNSAWRTFWGIK